MPDRSRFENECAAVQKELHACKRNMGLFPAQCYPVTSSGECDKCELEFKKCISFVADTRSAKVLYDTSGSRTRQERADANRQLQHKLRAFNVPCTP